MLKWSITTPRQQACWLAQISVESGALSRLEENLAYSAERALAVFPSHFANLADAQNLCRSRKDFADRIYGCRMGNAADEGYTFRGRGLKQLTGRDNYAAYEAATGRPVLAFPDLLLDPKLAADSAGWFWSSKGCSAFADVLDIDGLTHRINGGSNGLAERKLQTTKALKALGAV